MAKIRANVEAYKFVTATKNSYVFLNENKERVYCARKIWDKLFHEMEEGNDPEAYLVTREWQGRKQLWIATLMTY
jgi:hypothetical protein